MAAAATLPDVYQLPCLTAASLEDPSRGAPDLSTESPQHIDVTLATQLSKGRTGLRTDIKVAFAQLVSSGETSALRMCAFGGIAVSEERRRVLDRINPAPAEFLGVQVL